VEVARTGAAAVDGDNDPLYLAALAVEQNASLNDEMAGWDTIVGDGLMGTFATDRPR
jgi:hypothetical protein